MFRIETFRLIVKTFRRFLSLTLIVMIGAGFMMGLMSTPTVLRGSIDIYYDEYDLNDLVIYSPYGFCDEDYRTISSTDGVSNVFASKEIDCHGLHEKGESVTYRVSELSRENSQFKLVEGRMPTENDECLFLKNDMAHVYKLGDTITLSYGNNDINDYLSNSKYTIVGFYESPNYMSKIKGASNFNNEELECGILVPNVNFISDYYTTMYVTLEGARDILSNTDEYDKYIEEKRVDLENIVAKQQSYLRDKLIAEATETLDANEQLFVQIRDEGKKQLDDAKKQLDEAHIQIIAYEAQLNTLDALVRSLQSAIEADMGVFSDIHDFTADIETDIDHFLELLGLNGHYPVSGTMEYLYSEYNKAIAQYNSVKGQLNSAKAQYEEGLKKYEESLVKYEKEIAEGEQQLKLARAQLNDLPKSQWIILNRDQQYSTMMYKNTCQQMGTVGLYMPIMFFLVAALVCLTTMKRLVDEQRGQIGIYVALGYSNIQIIGKYVSYAMLASLAGGITGIIIGQALFPSVIYVTWRMMYYLPPMKIMFPMNYALISVGSFSVLMTSITAYVVHNCVKDVPASLMRPVAPKKGKIIFLQRIPFIWNMLSFTSKITARNIFRYKSRFLMTIAGIAGCTGLLILGFGVKDSVSDVLGIQYRDIFCYNDIIYFKNDEHIKENLEILENSENVDYAATYMEYTTRAYINGNEKTVNTVIVDPLDYYTLFDLKETDKKTPIRLNNDGVIVSEQFAKNNSLKIGDRITIESKNRIKQDVVIANICEMYFQHYIFMSDTLYSNTFDEDITKTSIAVLTDDDEAVRNIAKTLKDYTSVISTSYYLDSFSNMIEALNLVILVIILVAGSLAFVVLVNLTQVNISERIREIATLKVLGFNDHEVNMYIFKEILLLSVIGCFAGVPVGFIEHHFIMTALNMEMIMFAMTIKFVSIILSFMITIIFTIIVLFFMRKPLREVNMIESLKSVD